MEIKVIYIIIAVVLLLVLLAICSFKIQIPNTVSQSHEIDATERDIFNKIVDLETWAEWSPWIMHEPDVKLTFSQSPKSPAKDAWYEWEGKYIGSGRLTNTEIKASNYVKQDIILTKPFYAKSYTTWNLEKSTTDEKKIKVTWTMYGKIPLLLLGLYLNLKKKLKRAIR